MSETAAKPFVVDFSGKVQNSYQSDCFDEEVLYEIRAESLKGRELFVFVDTGFTSNCNTPFLVSDHLNLTGSNPLVGANNEIGERFPIVNNVYMFGEGLASFPDSGLEKLQKTKDKVAAGLKLGVVPTDEEIALINSLGADFYCYNLIPATIIAAHAKKKVCGLIVPPNLKPVDSLETLLEGIQNA